MSRSGYSSEGRRGHTPGPWTIDNSSGQDIVFGGDGMPVAHAMHRENWPADARLIAAAPELLRLLTRYRNETPLGNQPHMIAHEADALLAALSASRMGE